MTNDTRRLFLQTINRAGVAAKLLAPSAFHQNPPESLVSPISPLAGSELVLQSSQVWAMVVGDEGVDDPVQGRLKVVT